MPLYASVARKRFSRAAAKCSKLRKTRVTRVLRNIGHSEACGALFGENAGFMKGFARTRVARVCAREVEPAGQGLRAGTPSEAPGH